MHIAARQQETLALTDAGDEVVKSFLGEQRVLQTPEVELQHACHRVDIMVVLLVRQRVVTWSRGGQSQSPS